MTMIYRRYRILLIMISSTIPFLLFFAKSGVTAEKLIYSKDSLYHRILVYEDKFVRTLRFGAPPKALEQAKVNIRNLDRHLLEYSQLAFAGLLLNKYPAKVLIIGLGGGVIPRELQKCYPEAEIDIVEIDPEVAKVAKRFFYFHAGKKMRVWIRSEKKRIPKNIKRKSMT